MGPLLILLSLGCLVAVRSEDDTSYTGNTYSDNDGYYRSGLYYDPRIGYGPHPNPYPSYPDPYPTHPDPYPTNPDPYPTNPDPYPTNPDPYPTNPDPYPTNPNPYPTNPDPYPTHPDPYPPRPNPYPSYPDPYPPQNSYPPRPGSYYPQDPYYRYDYYPRDAPAGYYQPSNSYDRYYDYRYRPAYDYYYYYPQPPSGYPPQDPPTYPPTNPPTYPPPTQPPTYPPPTHPPTYPPPTYPPTYPPTNPPTYPPTHPPSYGCTLQPHPSDKGKFLNNGIAQDCSYGLEFSVDVCTCIPIHGPHDPPTYPPTNPPTYPPTNPPTYPPTYQPNPVPHPHGPKINKATYDCDGYENDGRKYAVWDVCYAYYECVHYEALYRECDNYYRYDDKAGRCVEDDTCHSACEHSSLKPHPHDETKFINGGYEFDCGGNLVFSTRACTCVRPYEW